MKARLLKLTLSFAMLFIAAGAFAQNLGDPFANYNLSSFQGGTATEDSAIVGTQIPYYVDPDPIINSYSGDYDTTATNAAQGIYTSFNWSISGDAHAPGDFTLTYPSASADTSAYVVVTMPATATGAGNADTLEVYEYNPGVSCPGPTKQVPMRIFAEPSFTVTSTGDADTLEVCSGTDITLTLNNVADNGIEPYGSAKFLMDSSVAQVSADDYSTVVNTIDGATDFVFSRDESAALTGGTFDFLTRNLVAQDGDTDGNPDVTRYMYTFKGMNDHISRKSDYYKLANQDPATLADTDFTFYDPTDGTQNSYVYVVFPTPQTGDIYYVPNDFDL